MHPPLLACVEPLAGILGAAALGLLAAYWRERRRSAGLAKALSDLETMPRTWEYRIERFDVLWYPTVTASEKAQEILSVVPGLPHCKSCLEPLKLGSGEWACRRCGAKHAESVGDMQVNDLVGAEALKHFQERRKGYRLVLKKQGP